VASLLDVVAKTVSDVAASGAAVNFDAPGGLSERLLQSLERSGFSPKTQRGCLAVLTGALTAQSLVRQGLGDSPVSTFFSGLLGSTIRQVGRRALNQHLPGIGAIELSSRFAPSPRREKGREAFFGVDTPTRNHLLRHYRQLKTDDQRRMYKEIMRSDAEQLQCIAEMPFEDLEALLSLLVQPSIAARANRQLEQVAETLFPWMR
jgi:hypothetical protein